MREEDIGHLSSGEERLSYWTDQDRIISTQGLKACVIINCTGVVLNNVLQHRNLRVQGQTWSLVAQLVEHGACNTRVVGLIPGTTHMQNVCMHDCKSLWIEVSAKWHLLLLYLNIHQ